MKQPLLPGHHYQTLPGLEAAIGKDLPSHSVSIDRVKFYALDVFPSYVLADIPFIPVPVKIPNAFVSQLNPSTRSQNLEEA